MTDTSGPQAEVETDFKVSFNESTVVCMRPDGVVDQVDWADLEAVTLEATMAEHPEPQHIWIMWGEERKSGCVFPGRAEGSSEIVEEMKRRLPKFDHRAFVSALNSDEHKTFIVWQSEELAKATAEASDEASGGEEQNPFLGS